MMPISPFWFCANFRLQSKRYDEFDMIANYVFEVSLSIQLL